jgi:hypothetical protein
MARRLVTWLLAVGVLAATQLCEQYGSVAIDGGRYVVQNNRWGTGATQCIDVTPSGFTVTQADGSVPTNGAPKSYPSVFSGCHYGTCSETGGLLGPTGLRASDARFRQLTSSVSVSMPAAGTWDAAYDIWFHKSRPSAATGQNDGAELMIWLNHRGPIQPIGSKVGTATVDGATWDVWYGGGGWNVISYVRQQTTTSLDFSVAEFWDDVVRRGYGSSDWYLTSIQAGFEPWEGGVGLAVNDFDVRTDGSTPDPEPDPDPDPEPDPDPAGTCTASYATVGTWGGGFQALVTVHNTGTVPISGWVVSWTFTGGQRVANAWNADLTQSGAAVTGDDAGYNAALAPGASTSFGFVGSGDAPASLPVACG